MVTETPVTTTTWPSQKEWDDCNYKNIITLSDGVLMIIYVLIGIFILILGSRKFAQTYYLVGFTSVGTIVYGILSSQEYLLPCYLQIYNWLCNSVAMAAGAVISLLYLSAIRVPLLGKGLVPFFSNFAVFVAPPVALSICPSIISGKFCIEIHLLGMSLTTFLGGIIIAIMGLFFFVQMVVQADNLPQFWSTVSVLLVCGIIFTCFLRKSIKGSIIVATSVYGSALISIIIDKINNNLFVVMWFIGRLEEEPVGVPCRFTWITLAAWLFMTILGIIIQCTLTGPPSEFQEQEIEEVQNPGDAQQSRCSCKDCFLPYCSETSQESGGPSPPYTPAKSLEDPEENIELPTLSGRISQWRSRLPAIAEEVERYCEQCHCCEKHPTKRLHTIRCERCLSRIRMIRACQRDFAKR